MYICSAVYEYIIIVILDLMGASVCRNSLHSVRIHQSQPRTEKDPMTSLCQPNRFVYVCIPIVCDTKMVHYPRLM